MKAIKTNYTHVVAPTTDTNVVAVADIARDLHMNPKHVRARMRRLWKHNDPRVKEFHTVAKNTWKFDVATNDVAALRALIASFANDGESNDNDGDE